MSALINFSINLDAIPENVKVKGKKGTYVNLTASVSDESNYGNNVSFSLSQTKEQRESKENKVYLGNGKVVWNDGKITNAKKEEGFETISQEDLKASSGDDLPF